MKVTVVRGGGLAGLVTTTTADTAWILPEHRKELSALVNKVRFFELPATVESAEATADGFNYSITVEDNGRSYTVTGSENALPGGVRALIAWLESLPDRQERVDPVGGF